MQMSVRFAFKRSGEIIATPRVTYASPDAPPEAREIYHDAITAALARCTPLPFSAGLGRRGRRPADRHPLRRQSGPAVTRCVQIIGEVLAIAALATGAAAQVPQAPVNTISELGAALRACWVPPPLDQSRPGMQITVQMTFRRNGELFGKPKITFESPARPTMTG